MKLNLSNLQNQDARSSASNRATQFTLSGVNGVQTQNGLLGANSDSSSNFTSNLDNITTNTEERTLTFSFTDNKVYDLDDIIRKKRRDNTDCPLFVYVQEDNPNDEAVLAQITKLILSDYGVAYTNDNYKTQVVYVPLFEEVFTNYFNTYYQIFVKQRSKVFEGSVSLISVLEEIVSYHENLVNGLIGETTRTYANSNSYNKPQVEWEYGTVYDNPTGEDITTFLPEYASQFSLKEIDGQLWLTFDGIKIPNSGITITTGNGGTDTRLESNNRFVHYPLDVEPFGIFTPVRIVQFRKKLLDLFTFSNVQIARAGE